MSTDAITMDDLKAWVALKAGEDAAFRTALLADAKPAVEQLMQADLPAHVKIRAVEEAPDTYIVVLPAPAATGELSDADLESVAGGSKAEAKSLASTVFGFGPGLAANVLGDLAKTAGDRQGGQGMQNAGRSLTKC